MDNLERLTINPAPHPVPEVHRAGFTLDHPYFEHCWSPVLGPSSTLLLRRLPVLWRDQAPVTLDLADLAGSLGLGQGTGRSSPLRHTLERIARFRMGSWSGPGELDVYTEVSPLSQRHLERVPSWTRQQHDRLLTRHLADLARPTLPPAAESAASRMSARLDHLQHRASDLGLAR